MNGMLLVTFIALCQTIAEVSASDDAAPWSYSGADGPANWSRNYTMCGQGDQSPIDLAKPANDELTMDAFELNGYSGDTTVELTNNGHTLHGKLNDASSARLKRTGIAGRAFEPLQFHFHWGTTDAEGSEHKVDGAAYPMEVHLVHKNDKYNMSAALANYDGLLVTGVFVEVGNDNSKILQLLDPHLDSLVDKDSTVAVQGLPLNDLLPIETANFDKKYNYFYYNGSLTTPGCNPAVQWHVFTDTLKITAATLQKFRNLKTVANASISGNFRPLQSLGGRKVDYYYHSHPSGASTSAIIQPAILALTVLVTSGLA